MADHLQLSAQNANKQTSQSAELFDQEYAYSNIAYWKQNYGAMVEH